MLGVVAVEDWQRWAVVRWNMGWCGPVGDVRNARPKIDTVVPVAGNTNSSGEWHSGSPHARWHSQEGRTVDGVEGGCVPMVV